MTDDRTGNLRAGRATLRAVLAAVLALALPGCNATRDLSDPASPIDRGAEAYRLSLRAQSAQRDGRTVEAIDLYRRAAELQPTMPGVWNNMGVLLMERQLYLDAVIAFKREADISPDDPRPYENLGLAYFQASHTEESVKYYELALERDPNRIESLRGLAKAASQRGVGNDSIAEHFRRALLLETDPAWRKVFESERLRVENQVRQDKDLTRIVMPK